MDKNEEYLTKIKNRYALIQKAVNESEYGQALRITSTLTWLFVMFNDPDNLFISEFFEWLFSNLNEATSSYITDKKELIKINNIISEGMIEIIKALDMEGEKRILQIYNPMKEIRFSVTEYQDRVVGKRKHGMQLMG